MKALSIRSDLAYTAVNDLGFGDRGDSRYKIFPSPDVMSFKASPRFPNDSSIETFSFGFHNLQCGVETNQAIYCAKCNSVGQHVAWCDHLAQVIKSRYDAVIMHAFTPTDLFVPIVPSMSCWVAIRISTPPMPDALRTDKYEDVEEDDFGYPYEVHLLYRTGLSAPEAKGPERKVFIGMLNQYDSMAVIRRQVFEWIESVNPYNEQIRSSCVGCDKQFTSPATDLQEKTLIALMQRCASCLTERQTEQAKKAADRAILEQAMKNVQLDPSLIPDVSQAPPKKKMTFERKSQMEDFKLGINTRVVTGYSYGQGWYNERGVV